MPSLIDLRRRIRAVKNTQQITKAMKMVAASKLRRAQERIQQARPFAIQMRRVLSSLAARVDPTAHPLLDQRRTPRANGRVLLTVADNGAWDAATREGTGLSIVRALVTEELDGELSLVADHGLRAEVAFPAS